MVQALTGTFDGQHAQLAKSILRQLELVLAALDELHVVMVEACPGVAAQIELLQTIPGSGRRSRS